MLTIPARMADKVGSQVIAAKLTFAKLTFARLTFPDSGYASDLAMA